MNIDNLESRMNGIIELRAYHERQLEAALICGGRYFINLHEGAIKAIDMMRNGLDNIVKILLEKLARKHAALESAYLSIQDQALDCYQRIESARAESFRLQQELDAERANVEALNDRLAECEARDAARLAESQGIEQAGPAQASREAVFLAAVRAEIDRARLKHPDAKVLCIAATEELGELAKALMDEPYDHVYTEAVQVASTAMRIALDGDRSVDFVRAHHGLDPLPGSPYAGL